MREIKFRAWNRKNREMFEVLGGGERFDFYIDNPNFSELMQFTGLKDKEGKDIYEGDIVRYTSRVRFNRQGNMNVEIGQIIWKNFSFMIDMIDPSYPNERFYSINQKDIEVIGNIYENLELIIK